MGRKHSRLLLSPDTYQLLGSAGMLQRADAVSVCRSAFCVTCVDLNVLMGSPEAVPTCWIGGSSIQNCRNQLRNPPHHVSRRHHQKMHRPHHVSRRHRQKMHRPLTSSWFIICWICSSLPNPLQIQCLKALFLGGNRLLWSCKWLQNS